MLTINIKDKKYNSKVILQNIKLEIPKNGLYGFVGKNGSGKTTFFKYISHLTDFQGEISYKTKYYYHSKSLFFLQNRFSMSILLWENFMIFSKN